MTDQEINEAVAQKLGWIINKTSDFLPWYGRPNAGPRSAMIRELPEYCRLIEAAWEIIAHMEALGFEFRLHIRHKAVTVEFAKTIYGETPKDEIKENWLLAGCAEYPEVPRAICLAFLKFDES